MPFCTSPREDDIFHASAAKSLGGLFAQHPAHGITEVGFSTSIRPDDRCNAVAAKLHLRPVVKGFESLDLDAFQFEQW